VFLGLALDGIARSLPLPPEVPVNPASLPEAERAPLALASTQGEALDALETSPLARELLGPEIVDAVLAVRRYEQRTYGDADPEVVAAVCRLAFSC
jgi:glutamine synthetase